MTHSLTFQTSSNLITVTNGSIEAGISLMLHTLLIQTHSCFTCRCTSDRATLCCLNLIHWSVCESWDLPFVLVIQVLNAAMHPGLASKHQEPSCVLCHFVFEVYLSHWVLHLIGHSAYIWLNTKTSRAPVSWRHMVHAALCFVAVN